MEVSVDHSRQVRAMYLEWTSISRLTFNCRPYHLSRHNQMQSLVHSVSWHRHHGLLSCHTEEAVPAPLITQAVCIVKMKPKHTSRNVTSPVYYTVLHCSASCFQVNLWISALTEHMSRFLFNPHAFSIFFQFLHFLSIICYVMLTMHTMITTVTKPLAATFKQWHARCMHYCLLELMHIAASWMHRTLTTLPAAVNSTTVVPVKN